MSSINYPYALDLLKRLNSFVYADPKIVKQFEYQGYDFWQAYQQRIFASIKEFSKGSDICSHTTSSGVKGVLGRMLALCISVVSVVALVVTRRPVLVYSVDNATGQHGNDFRMDAVYTFLHQNAIRYGEVFHSLLDKKFLRNLRKRRRLGVYLEAIPVPRIFRGKQTHFNLSSFPEPERAFVAELLNRYLAEVAWSVRKVNILRVALRFSGVRILLAIDDVRYYQEIILACRANNIRTYAFQHGHFTKYHVGWLVAQSETRAIAPDAIFVWSEYWKQELLRLGTYFTAQQVVVGGVSDTPQIQRQDASGREDISVLIPYETDAPKGEVARYVTALEHCKNVTIFFKLRPDIPSEIQLAEYGINEGQSNVVPVHHVKDVIARSNVVLGTYSTFLYDMIGYGKPIGFLRTSLDYGEGLVLNHLADAVSIEGNVCAQVEALKETPLATLKERRQRLYGNAAPLSETLAQLFKR